MLQSTMHRGYRIRDLIEEFGVTARTLRHYEDIGLVHPERDGSARVYSGRDRARLKIALRGKRLGLALEEIRELFELYDQAAAGGKLDAFATKLERHRATLEKQRQDLDAMLGDIRFFAEQCRRMLQGNETVRMKTR